MQETFSVIIPARLGSTRLKQKVLLPLNGKPIIQHTYEQALKSGAERVIIATDDPIIVNVVKEFGAEVILTNPEHQSGTDRLAEAARQIGLIENEIIVNVQGDEPLIHPDNINQVAFNLSQCAAQMATLCEKITSEQDIHNPNIVKVVFNKEGMAHYFSRAAIPFIRDVQDNPKALYHRHIGLYAYRANFLQSFSSWSPAPLELIEKLEQLRALYHGAKIHISLAKELSHAGVDVMDDLIRLEKVLNES